MIEVRESVESFVHAHDAGHGLAADCTVAGAHGGGTAGAVRLVTTWHARVRRRAIKADDTGRGTLGIPANVR